MVLKRACACVRLASLLACRRPGDRGACGCAEPDVRHRRHRHRRAAGRAAGRHRHAAERRHRAHAARPRPIRWPLRLHPLPPAGQYVLQTALAGFATERRENLTFNAGQRVVLNVTLKLSSVQETVTVAGDSPVVQTTTSEVTKTIESRDLATLPVPERNYFRLLTLDSNVVARGPGTNGLYVGGGDVWNFGTYVDGTSNFSKWLTLQRAPQRGSPASRSRPSARCRSSPTSSRRSSAGTRPA